MPLHFFLSFFLKPFLKYFTQKSFLKIFFLVFFFFFIPCKKKLAFFFLLFVFVKAGFFLLLLDLKYAPSLFLKLFSQTFFKIFHPKIFLKNIFSSFLFFFYTMQEKIGLLLSSFCFCESRFFSSFVRLKICPFTFS